VAGGRFPLLQWVVDVFRVVQLKNGSRQWMGRSRSGVPDSGAVELPLCSDPRPFPPCHPPRFGRVLGGANKMLIVQLRPLLSEEGATHSQIVLVGSRNLGGVGALDLCEKLEVGAPGSGWSRRGVDDPCGSFREICFVALQSHRFF